MTQPLVSVVTPVFNAKKYLSECIQSVLVQTYSNWEYVIVDNCSTDASGEIAADFAKKDNRIRLVENDSFLSQMENWNRAMRQISPRSRYCKVVHADDWLFPECIERMVDVAEKNPRVGIVGAYRLDETQVNLDGLPFPSNAIPGRKICRDYLLGGPYVFGSPTSLLICSDIIRKKDPFYNGSSIHADVEVCLDILSKWDFGFVYQVLTFTRRHNEATTSFLRRFSTYRLARLLFLHKYGPRFLSPNEYQERFQKMLDAYCRFIVRSLVVRKDKELYSYHRNGLSQIGIKLSTLLIFKALLTEFSNLRHFFSLIKIRMKNKGSHIEDTRSNKILQSQIISRSS